MIERQPFRLERHDFVSRARNCRSKSQYVRHSLRGMRTLEHNAGCKRWQRGLQLHHHGAAVRCSAGVMDAIDGDEYFGLNLAESIGDRLRTHIGSAQAPDSAYARAGKKGNTVHRAV